MVFVLHAVFLSVFAESKRVLEKCEMCLSWLENIVGK